MSSVLHLVRPDIVALAAYQPARWDPALLRLHANEMPLRAEADVSDTALNRYPEPYHETLDRLLADLYGVPADCALATRGSDEAIDLLVRAFCRAGQDSVLVCPPTFAMYETAARIQGAAVVSVPLQHEREWALDAAGVLAQCRSDVKLVFLCTPNNPTGNLLDPDAVLQVARSLTERAVVVVDEAYLEFAGAPSLATRLTDLPNVVLLRTCSKAYALAGARIGTLLAAPEIVDLVRKILPPYAIAQPSIDAAFKVLAPAGLRAAHARIDGVLAERARLAAALEKAPGVLRVWPSATNFLLVELADPARALQQACAAGLLVRDVRSQHQLSRALRITVGTSAQNDRLLEALS